MSHIFSLIEELRVTIVEYFFNFLKLYNRDLKSCTNWDFLNSTFKVLLMFCGKSFVKVQVKQYLSMTLVCYMGYHKDSYFKFPVFFKVRSCNKVKVNPCGIFDGSSYVTANLRVSTFQMILKKHINLDFLNFSNFKKCKC